MDKILRNVSIGLLSSLFAFGTFANDLAVHASGTSTSSNKTIKIDFPSIANRENHANSGNVPKSLKKDLQLLEEKFTKVCKDRSAECFRRVVHATVSPETRNIVLSWMNIDNSTLSARQKAFQDLIKKKVNSENFMPLLFFGIKDFNEILKFYPKNSLLIHDFYKECNRIRHSELLKFEFYLNALIPRALILFENCSKPNGWLKTGIEQLQKQKGTSANKLVK